MIRFSNCKINIGLDIVSKRQDGYHDIVTVMYPVPWHDIVEIISSENNELIVLGNKVDCQPCDNLVVKAYKLMQDNYNLPNAKIILKKIIPDGAGLGGGSGDAASVILAANEMYNLDLDKNTMATLAAKLGADCPFFIYDNPMIATGTGTTLSEIDLNLKGYTLVIAKKAGISISTRQAYAGVVPSIPMHNLEDLVKLPVSQWQGLVKNDFENSIFKLAPQLGHIKADLLNNGAIYASMTGSGCAVYGIFESKDKAKAVISQLDDCVTFVCDMQLP